MTKKAVWNKDNEEFLSKLLNAGATAAQASDEINNKFDMYFSRNAIISKARRLKLEFVVRVGRSYIPGSIKYNQTYKIKKADNVEFMKAWKANIKIHELETMFGIKRKSILEKAKKLKLDKREIDEKRSIRDINYSKDIKFKKLPSFIRERQSFPNPKALGLKLLELRNNQCRYILGSERPSDFLYCAAPVEPDSPVPYCPTCRAIVYVKPSGPSHKIFKLYR
jgi:hypothetical protein